MSLTSERIVNPDKTAMRPLLLAKFIDNNPDFVTNVGLDPKLFRDGLVIASVIDSGTPVSMSRTLVASGDIPPFMVPRIHQNRINFAARTAWHLDQDIFPYEVLDLLTVAYRHTSQSWENQAEVGVAFKAWSDARTAIEANPAFMEAKRYYNAEHLKVQLSVMALAPQALELPA